MEKRRKRLRVDSMEYHYEKDRPIAAEIHDGMILVTLADERLIGNPLE
jgi:hypothetical protein